MSEKSSITMVAVIAVIAIAGLVYFEGDGSGAFIIQNRHSCGGNVIGYDVPSYYAGAPQYYECFICPRDMLNSQSHVMCEYLPVPSMPIGYPRGSYSAY